uniref:Integrase catalytic domain-containing protein n=1 Tax=Trichogramma kaykai TaxID=54128 RepID=A0ABD2W2S8_9HYME
MSKDIDKFVKNCLHCQQAKISRHNKLIPAQFTLPDARFSHVHIDIVTLQESEGFVHALTMIDRYSRWPEAVPIKDMQTSTVARAFIDTWVSRFGAPQTITSDQGLQFESELFNELCNLLGTNRIRTTPYHPSSNGMIERWHRDFKTALIAFESSESWTRILPLVMLGLRTRIRSDIDASLAEVLFGSSLRLPGEFFSDQNAENDRQFFTKELRQFMRNVRPIPATTHSNFKPFVHKKLGDCSHVFVRTTPIKKGLEPPYLGPFKVQARPSPYFYVIRALNKKGVEKLKTVSTSRIKPAHGTRADIDNCRPEISEPDHQAEESILVDSFDDEFNDNYNVVLAPDMPYATASQKTTKKCKPRNTTIKSILKPKSSMSTQDANKKEKKHVRLHLEHSYHGK